PPRAFARALRLEDIVCLPISALHGDNIVHPSTHTPWYHGPTLVGYLETVQIDDDLATRPFRMPVQWVNRPDLDFRGFSGAIGGGTLRPGGRGRIAPSAQTSTVERVVTLDGDLAEAVAGESVTVTLADEIDVSRGDVLARGDAPTAGSPH